MNADERRFDQAVAMARGHVYAFLAAALADPVSKHFELALDKRIQTVAMAAAQLLADERGPHELDLMPVGRELAAPREEIARQHREVFGLLVAKNAPPYETEYCRSTLTFYRTQQLADIAGFYLAFGLEPNRDDPERQDHISVELEFMARLIQKELAAAGPGQAEICRDAQQKFLADHLAWWAPAFARLLRSASDGLYGALGAVLAAFIAGERTTFRLGPADELAETQPEPDAPEEESCCEAMPTVSGDAPRCGLPPLPGA